MDKHAILFIGLIEENKERRILKYAKELFLLSSYNVIYNNIAKDIVGFSNGKTILIVFDFIPKDLSKVNLNNLYFDIIIHSSINSDENAYIDNLFKLCKICVINSDDVNWISLVKKLKNGIAITYGFNSKSTLTISSYNINQITEVNLCLQRDITPIYGERLESFEFSLEITSEDKDLIYPVLAAATLNLIIGDTVLSNKPNNIIKINC